MAWNVGSALVKILLSRLSAIHGRCVKFVGGQNKLYKELGLLRVTEIHQEFSIITIVKYVILNQNEYIFK